MMEISNVADLTLTNIPLPANDEISRKRHMRNKVSVRKSQRQCDSATSMVVAFGPISRSNDVITILRMVGKRMVHVCLVAGALQAHDVSTSEGLQEISKPPLLTKGENVI